MSATPAPPPARELNDPELIRRINTLRTIDNVTNWFYLAREYLLLGGVVGLTIYFFQNYDAWGLSWIWTIPAALLAIVLIGAGQHRLTNLAHEASHYMLFRNRLLNDLVSDWFSMFPMLSCTHHYRLQHLAHHQFVNDPKRDPDIAQLSESGHRYEFPMPHGRFVWECVVKQLLWFPNLIRYIRIRAKYNSTGGGSGPYQAKGQRSKALVLLGVLYLLGVVGALSFLVMHGAVLLLGIVPPLMLAGALVFYGLVPGRFYQKSLVKPDISMRAMTLMRLTYLTGTFSVIAWLTYLTGDPWPLYYIVLWIIPMLTTFSFFMILRQVVQHGNAGCERLSNTRIFKVNRLIQLSVFPWGMDYHLPHHMFPMVPHYRLRELHDLLMEAQTYRQQATIVEGYFLPKQRPPTHPTVLDLMAGSRR